MFQRPAPGDPAPDFDLPATGGARANLQQLRGKIVVLYFYPKDDTSGCTTEALNFNAKLDDFTAAGAVVIGVSKDPLPAHERFQAKHGFAVRLASAAEADVCERYGVWGEKSMYGRKYMGIERATFLIDAAGVVRGVWSKVKVPGHAEAVLAAVRALQQP